MSAPLDDQSIRAQIEGLDVGETYARAARFDADETPKHVPAEVLSGLRLGLQSTCFKVEKRTGVKFTIECGEFRTASRDTIVCAAVTRTR